jgi:hypothetical protein
MGVCKCGDPSGSHVVLTVLDNELLDLCDAALCISLSPSPYDGLQIASANFGFAFFDSIRRRIVVKS